MGRIKRPQAISDLFFSFIILILLTISRSQSVNTPSQQIPQFQQLKQQQFNGTVANNNNINNAFSAIATSDNFKPLIQAALAAASPKTLGTTLNPAIDQALVPATANSSDQQQQFQQQQQQSQQQQKFGSQPQQQQQFPTSLASYGNDEPITLLDYSSFNDEILRKKTASFVYFNANFNHCRHCHRFYNVWKELAIDIRWWRLVVRLFTINCSDEDNIDVCRRAGVTQFPQVRYYWIMSNSLEQDGQRIRILGKSVHAMRHLIMDKVLESYTEHNKLLMQRYKQQQQKSSPSSSPSLNQATGGGSNLLLALMTNPMISSLLNTNSNSGATSATSSLSSANKSPIATSSSSTSALSSLMSLMGGGGGGGSGLQSISQLINLFLGATSNKQRNIAPMPSNWPEMELIEVSDSQQLVDMLPLDASKNIGALLIMETQEFLYTGLEVMLDLNPYGNQTYIARVRDERSQLSKNLTKRDDIQAPALIYVTSLKEPKLIITAPKYTNDEDLRRVFVRAFERRQIKYPVRRVWSKSSAANAVASNSDSPQEDEEILSKIHQVFMDDLTNALRISLMEQVFRHPDLSDDQYNALVRYVYVVINYFPFNNDDSLKFFKRLHTWLQNQVSPMDIGEYKKQFHDIDDVLQQRDWIACKSLSNTKSIPSKSRKSGSLFENPAQFGKVVSNITRLFRDQQKQASKLKNLFSMFTSNNPPVMLTNQPSSGSSRVNGVHHYTQQPSGNNNNINNTTTTPTQQHHVNNPSSEHKNGGGSSGEESPLERIIKSLTSGSLGSDSSILKLISTALTGAGSDSSRGGGGGKSKFAREYPCGAWKLAHVMVVNEYIKDSPRKDVKHIVLHSLYQYMLHFYTCSTCGNRVSDIRGEFRLNLDDYLFDQADSVLLLWKMHNRVSKRLESEIRPGSPPKVQFPNESLCAKCRTQRAQNDLVSTPVWHEKQVLNFLVHHYRPQSLLNNNNNNARSSSSNLSLALDFAIPSGASPARFSGIPRLYMSSLDWAQCLLLHLMTISCLLSWLLLV